MVAADLYLLRTGDSAQHRGLRGATSFGITTDHTLLAIFPLLFLGQNPVILPEPDLHMLAPA